MIKIEKLHSSITLQNTLYELQGKIADFERCEVFIYVNNPGVEDNDIDPITAMRNKKTGEITLCGSNHTGKITYSV